MRRAEFVRKILTGAVLALLLTGSAHAGSFENIYTSGHADLNIYYDSSAGMLGLNYEFGSNAVINGSTLGAPADFEASEITTYMGLNSRVVGPAGLPAPFGGSTLFVLPQSSRPNRPFLGIGAESIDPGVFQGDLVTLMLIGFASRPVGGEVVLWQAGSEGSPYWNSADGLSSADHVEVGTGGHDHFSWGFTTAGIYDLILEARGTLANGSEVSGRQIYRFQAVPEPSSVILLGSAIGVIGSLLVRRRIQVKDGVTCG